MASVSHRRPTEITSVSSAFWPLDSGTYTFAATANAFVDLFGGNSSMHPSSVWFKPRGRNLRAGDVITIRPKFSIARTAATDQPLYLRAAIRSSATGALIRMAGVPTTFGEATWRVEKGTVDGAGTVIFSTSIRHRVRADEICPQGGIFVDAQHASSHTAGAYTLVETAYFVSNPPASLTVTGPEDPIGSYALAFTGQSLGVNQGDGQFDDLYNRRVHATLSTGGKDIGFSVNNWSGTTYDQRDYWDRMFSAPALSFARVIVIDDGGSSDNIGGQSAASLLTEIEAFADACRAAQEAGVIKYVRLTMPPSDLMDASAEAERLLLNTAIRANTNGKFDAVIDLAAWDASLDDDTTNYFNDGTHWTVLGHTAAAAAIVAGLTTAGLV